MKPTMTLFVLLSIAHGLAVGLMFLAVSRGQWMGAAALLGVSLLPLQQQVRMVRLWGCARAAKGPGE